MLFKLLKNDIQIISADIRTENISQEKIETFLEIQRETMDFTPTNLIAVGDDSFQREAIKILASNY